MNNMQSNYALQPAAAQPVAVIPQGGVLTSFTTLPQMMEVARALASSPLVPKHFANNEGSVMIALNMAQRVQMDPFLLMQNIYVVHGTPSMSGQFAIAMLSRSARYKRIEYCYVNDKDYRDGMYVKGHRRDDSKPDVGTAITPDIVRGEGWEKNPKWRSMPEQMYRYRSASWFARAFVPDELMGMKTQDEIEDIQMAKELRNVTPTPAPVVAAVCEAIPEAPAVELKPKAKVKSVSKDKAEVQAKAVEKAPAPEPSVAAPAPVEATPSAWDRFLALLAKHKMTHREFRSWCEVVNICLPPAADAAKEDYALWFFAQSKLVAGLRETYGSRVTML